MGSDVLYESLCKSDKTFVLRDSNFERRPYTVKIFKAHVFPYDVSELYKQEMSVTHSVTGFLFKYVRVKS